MGVKHVWLGLAIVPIPIDTPLTTAKLFCHLNSHRSWAAGSFFKSCETCLLLVLLSCFETVSGGNDPRASCNVQTALRASRTMLTAGVVGLVLSLSLSRVARRLYRFQTDWVFLTSVRAISRSHEVEIRDSTGRNQHLLQQKYILQIASMLAPDKPSLTTIHTGSLDSQMSVLPHGTVWHSGTPCLE